jgi:predicted GNAT family N-acyltransferase
LADATWEADRDRLLNVRLEVFVEEQAVPIEEEQDEHDPHCTHLLVVDDSGAPIATGRMMTDGHIGRMAVRRPWRGRGLGGAILEALIERAAGLGLAKVVLAAQTHAIPFYERHGFRAYGDEFMDAGIPHFWMDRAV